MQPPSSSEFICNLQVQSFLLSLVINFMRKWLTVISEMTLLVNLVTEHNTIIASLIMKPSV